MIRGQLYILTLLVLLVLYTTQLPGQRTQPYFHNFTTEDGLPSSETYCAVQDKDGYMWIGTDNGVARFDGYEFEVFGPEHGLTDVVVFDVVEDTHGTLWFMTYSGQLFWFDGNIFKPYKYNDQIINFEKKTKRVLNLVDVWPDGSVVIRSGNIEMKVISPAGEIRNFNPSKKFDLYIYGTPKTQHSIIASEKYKTQKDFQKKDIFIFKEGNWKQVDYIKREELVLEFKTGKYSYVLGAYNHQNDETFAFIYGNIYYKNSDSTYIKNNVFGKKINYILPHPKEGFWVAMGNNLGTHHCYIKQKNITCDVLLEDITLNEISYDKQGGLWICSQGSGLFYSQNPEISTYNATDKKKFPIAIESIGKDHYLASYNDIGIIDHNTTSSEIIRLDKTGKYYSINQIMKYDSCAQTIFLAQGKIDYSSKRAPFNPYQRNYFELHNYIQDYSHISHLDYIKNKSLKCNDTVFIILNNIAYEVTSSKLESRQKPIYKPNINGLNPTACGRDQFDRPLIGTKQGLFEAINDSTLQVIHPQIPELRNRIISIDNLIQGGTLIATRGGGIVILVNDTVKVIKKQDGLISDQIRGIHQTPDGIIWLNSFTGLGKLILKEGGEIEEISSFTTSHGLPSNEIYDISSYENDIWLATRAGVVQFIEPETDSISPEPLIRTFEIDGNPQSDSTSISPGQHDLKITYNTINYQMLGEIPYRYRINPNEAWQYTTNRTVEYPNLAPGNYQFEVQSQNQDLFWSQSTLIPFEIPLNWYQTWWAKTLWLGLLTSVIAALFYLREKRRREEFDMIAQIDALERSAIQAQMNPHFVFNSLNSIQYFILESDTKQAVYYLARFASLIRKTLRASVDGVHSLKEEVDMLRIYLTLEKLRFKDTFDYQITIAPHIKPERIHLAPMLVQPFVENAIIHGVAGMHAGGMITVHFAGSCQELHATITDNGKGFDPDSIDTTGSLGVNITRKRLNKNLNNKQLNGLKIESNSDQNSKATGTTIYLRIKPTKKEAHV